MKTFYDELKDLCKKHNCYAGVYVRSNDEEDTEKHKVFCITGTEDPTKEDVGMMMETIMYFINALFYAAKDKFYVTHIILDLVSTVIKSYKKDDEKNENAG